jgi:uridine kinase
MADIEALADRIADSPDRGGLPVKIVAIDGRGGAGKSTLAEGLAATLRASIVHTDDFATPENPFEWAPDVIAKVFEPIRDGAAALGWSRTGWWDGHIPEPVVDLPVTPTLILEGVSAARREFRPYLSFAVWVETPPEVCLQRGLDRDQGRERDGQDAAAIWAGWVADEDAYIARDDPTSYVDVIVRGDDDRRRA